MAPRLGFLGVGWIGRDRMRAIAASGTAEVHLVADVDASAAQATVAELGGTVVDVDELLHHADIDGLVIATPSAMHAEQAIAALHRGVAVFCQKPLGRTAAEAADVVAAARRARRPLAVDLSYRHLDATRRIRSIIEDGEIGDVYAAELVFHNAYGPDKAWFLDRQLSGGGCVIDLATHLVDLAAWLLPGQHLAVSTSRLYAGGRPLVPAAADVEDFAAVSLDATSGATISLTCSWFVHAGQDAVIRATFYGSSGAVSVENVGGSFYDFEGFIHRGTSRERVSGPPDDWGGRAAIEWARSLSQPGTTEMSEVDDLDDLVATAAVIDAIYAKHACAPC